MAPKREKLLLLVILTGSLLLGLVPRWQHLAVASALGDAMGPWWSAARPGLVPPPHAPIYGEMLALPHRLILPGAGSLWEAMSALFAVQALVGPVAALLAFRLCRRLLPALVAGAVVALDPGLLDTTTSGAEGYLGALWIGVLALITTLPRASWLAGPVLALAVASHPLALCALPLLVRLPRRRSTLVGLGLGLLVMLPQMLRILGESGAGTLGLGEAVDAWLDHGGPGAFAVLLGLAAGLLHRRSRSLSLATLGSLGLLLLLGEAGGYLRDHHLRLLTVPAAAGLAGLPGPSALLVLLLLRVPGNPVERPAQARRPGSLGLETQLVEVVAARPGRPLVVDGAWISGTPAAEPGALLLDLHLRGLSAEELRPGGAVLLLVSAEREDLSRIPDPPQVVARGDRHRLVLGTADEIRDWTATLCQADLPPPRLGGAWDGMALLHPGLGAEAVSTWHGCPDKNPLEAHE